MPRGRAPTLTYGLTPLRRLLLDRGISGYRLALDLQDRGHTIRATTINLHAQGKRGINLQHAVMYAEYFGVEPKYFIV
jgi:hypothetical protein